MEEEGGGGHTSSQDAQGESNCPVLKDEEVETSVDSPCPNEDICNDSSSEMVRVHGDSAGPVQSNKTPCQWASENSDMRYNSWTRVSSSLG